MGIFTASGQVKMFLTLFPGALLAFCCVPDVIVLDCGAYYYMCKERHEQYNVSLLVPNSFYCFYLCAAFGVQRDMGFSQSSQLGCTTCKSMQTKPFAWLSQVVST